MIEERNYPALTFISGLYKVLAYIAFGSAILIPLIIFIGVNNDNSIISGIGAISALYIFLVCAFAGIFSLAIAEVIKLFIDIEENTRETAVNSNRINDILNTKQRLESESLNQSYCPNCGKANSSNSTYCEKCGQKL